MLLLVSKTIYVSVRTSLIIISYGASVQLFSHNLLFCYSGGGAKEVVWDRESNRSKRTRRARQAQPADLNITAISQAAAGTVAIK